MTDILDRGHWPVLLMAVPAPQVHALVAALETGLLIEDRQLPQSGLGLLTLRDSALGDQYFPGEIPLARAMVRVSASNGASADGAALILDDRAGLARSIAVLDAVLSARLEGHHLAQPLLQAGARVLAAQRAERKAMLAATKVNFSLVSNGEEDDGDEQ